MKRITAFVLIMLCVTCHGYGQEVPLPPGYSQLATVTGDLDNDGTMELIAAYNTRTEKDEDPNGVPRELIIYKKNKKGWIEWKKSSQALLGSKDGGMMGDPFGEMRIENGALIISHNGGSSWKWDQTDTYRFDNGDIYLTGFATYYGKLCEYHEEISFDLVSGKINLKRDYEDCDSDEQQVTKTENESFSEPGLKITMEKRRAEDVMIVSPEYKHEIYIATKAEY